MRFFKDLNINEKYIEQGRIWIGILVIGLIPWALMRLALNLDQELQLSGGSRYLFWFAYVLPAASIPTGVLFFHILTGERRLPIKRGNRSLISTLAHFALAFLLFLFVGLGLAIGAALSVEIVYRVLTMFF